VDVPSALAASPSFDFDANRTTKRFPALVGPRGLAVPSLATKRLPNAPLLGWMTHARRIHRMFSQAHGTSWSWPLAAPTVLV
jgi:hypothetical protein